MVWGIRVQNSSKHILIIDNIITEYIIIQTRSFF